MSVKVHLALKKDSQWEGRDVDRSAAMMSDDFDESDA